MTDVIQNLLVLYAGLLFINLALSTALWWRSGDPLYRALVSVWAATVVSFVVQGVFVQNDLVVTWAFASVFPVNLALAHLVSLVTGVPLHRRRYVAVLLFAVAAAPLLWWTGADFTLIALPVALAVCLPALVTAIESVAHGRRSLSISARALLVSSVLFSAHNVDFAFLRDQPRFAALGFTLATLIIFSLSITAPAVVLELVAQREARVSAEMEAAHRIQTRMVPPDTRVPGLEIVSHVRPAESVGGDYLDVHSFGEQSWLLLGDVTGHGLGAGLVMLMAQSTISSILQSRDDISPRELNLLANRILHSNLRRLDEARHMTVVSLRREAGNVFSVSGAHDDIYIVRASTAEVEPLPLSHFPMGLGFIDDLGIEEVGEDTFQLDAGDLLFIGTDGITEAAPGGDPLRGMFGEDALKELLSDHAAAPLCEIRDVLLTRLEAFTGGTYDDDVAFILARATAEEDTGAATRGAVLAGTAPSAAPATAAGADRGLVTHS